MKHSKGPWAQVERSTGDIHIQAADGVNIALVTVADYKRQAANARLIAATPELLTALEALINFVDPLLATGQLPDDLKQFEKALYVAFRASSKARGES